MKNWNALIYITTVDESGEAHELTEAARLGITRAFLLSRTDARDDDSPRSRTGQSETPGADSGLPQPMNVPLPDFSDPRSRSAHELWECAFSAACSVSEGYAVFVLAPTDERHASVFTCAVLIILGYTAEAALNEISDSGFTLPTDDHAAFLTTGIPAPIMRTMPPADTIDRSDRIHHGPNDNYREEWLSLQRTRQSHPSLGTCGMRSITDPFSDRWQCSSATDKLHAFASLAKHLLSQQKDLPHHIDPVGLTSLVGADLFSFDRVRSPDTLLFRSMFFAQALFIPDYLIPVTREAVDAEYREYQQLKHKDAVRAAEQIYEEDGIGSLPLGPAVLDPVSDEAQRAELSKRLAAVKAAAECRPSFKAAIMIHRYRHGNPDSDLETRQLAKTVLTLAAVAAAKFTNSDLSLPGSSSR